MPNVDYDALYRELRKGPMTRMRVRELTGCGSGMVQTVIDNLSLRYPLYEKLRGVYTLLPEGTEWDKAEDTP
jgi:hypothetical protein